jgi:hypothetical protein
MSYTTPVPGIYADCLFNTNLLPANITGSNSQVYNKVVSGSINGSSYVYTDPETQADMINNVNAWVSTNCYGSGFGGYVCSGPSAAVKPCRYIVMHSGVQNPPQAAHQLLIDAAGNPTFITTNWTS